MYTGLHYVCFTLEKKYQFLYIHPFEFSSLGIINQIKMHIKKFIVFTLQCEIYIKILTEKNKHNVVKIGLEA